MGDEQQSLLPRALGGDGLAINPTEVSGPRSNCPNSAGSVKIAVFMWMHCFLKLIFNQSAFCVSEQCECVPSTPAVVGRGTQSMAASVLETETPGKCPVTAPQFIAQEPRRPPVCVD